MLRGVDSATHSSLSKHAVVPYRTIAAGMMAKTASSSHVPLDYARLIKARDGWSSWMASLGALALITFSTSANLYFQLRYHNNLHVTFADRYSSDKEWLFGVENTAPLNISTVYAFIMSDDGRDVTRLIAAFQSARPKTFDNSTACVARVGLNTGSFYAFCDQLEPKKLPLWAQEFEALILQTMYLATAEQFRLGTATPFLGIAQGFPNQRTGWYQQSSTERLYCTTRLLAGVASTDDRVLFTRAHGVLRGVDCTAKAEESNAACKAIHGLEPFVLFPDGTGILRAYEVVRTANGRDFILSPFSSKDKMGDRTDVISQWPFDDCLYVRKGSLGWFGAGYLTFLPQIPTLALIAKIQLMAMLFVVWFVKFRCALNRVHDALLQLSRLGYFLFLMIQVVGSAYQEHDILRTIYSWETRTWDEWLLLWYIESTVALAGGLLALAVLRAALGSAICRVGEAITMVLPIVIACVELEIARAHYAAYTIENDLLLRPSTECGTGYDACGKGKFNYLHCTGLLTLLPASFELARKHLRSNSRVHEENGGLVTLIQPMQLTTFEYICPDKMEVARLVHDCDEPYADISNVRHVKCMLVTTCGFTVITDRFVVRTKDLVLLLASAILPRWALRDVSVVVWPLCVHQDGIVRVSPARKVYLQCIHNVAINPGHESASVIRSEEQPLA